MHKYHASRKRARLRWRQSDKGKAWDKAYRQRPYVKAKAKAKYSYIEYKEKMIKEYQEEKTNNILIEILQGILITDGLKDEQIKTEIKNKKVA